ncbi:hypothetical protein [Aquimarina megaterium]|uniref:hypothetical protein n=1 Tax=Aquimarina megaterium TaxID=1443666 RepID=UPI000944D9F0|nr:hypothetical protein [Aquimarina megaterium]
MAKWADYLVSKEKWIPNTKTVDSFTIYIDNGDSVSNKSYDVNRNWIVEQLSKGMTFCCIIRKENGKWYKGSYLTLSSRGGLNWNNNLPLILPKRKSFISYYHKDDSNYKEKFENLTSDLIVNKSVEEGDIDSDPDYGSEKYSPIKYPQKFIDNLNTKYAILRDYTTDRIKLQRYIEQAFDNRIYLSRKDNSRIQMKINTCS